MTNLPIPQQKSPTDTGPSFLKVSETSHIFCTKCGEKNLENNYRCTACASLLHEAARPQYTVSDNTMGGLIPTKNSCALIGYYLGVFSLIPFLGIPLGVAALILGIKGLKHAKQHPEAGGVGHSWTAMILGGFSTIAYTLLIAAPIIVAAAS